VRIRALLLVAAPMAAHMVSISTGEIRLEGDRATYEIRMPLFEIQHMADPAKALLDGVAFRAGNVEATRLEGSCRKVADENAMVCRSVYRFPVAVETLEAVSKLHQATVPQHVHLLRAVRGDFTDQAVMDLSFPRAQLRFVPPTPFENAVRQLVSGAVRAGGGAAQWLFLVALALAARSRRELVALAAMFVLGEAMACFGLPLTSWQPAPRFVEAAAALTIAYLAVEILLLADAGQRWLVVGVLGLFHGLYFALFIQSGGMATGWVLGGVVAAEAVLLAGIAWGLSRLGRVLERWRPVRAAAVALLAIGLGWFFLRLYG
jgi:hydrogenase/urease accessory protein HupE